MILSNVSIKTRLALGFGIVIFLTFIFGLTTLVKLNKLTGLNRDMYEHPLVVENAVRDIKLDITTMHRSMKDVVLSDDADEIKPLASQIDLKEKQYQRSFDLISKIYLGDKREIIEANDAFRDWKGIRSEVFILMEEGDSRAAGKITMDREAEHLAALDGRMEKIGEFAAFKADQLFLEVKRTGREAISVKRPSSPGRMR
ncbi:MAG: MCP four helix bundle domain-containing protein [Candidatus Eisenbacteria bacterium]|uniref:MCP four helix bundle domain-containing protein n=1 Tax=Eiseniibacteriota bacterium TaxID=2212470 RepID=A0A948RXB7_UNCEI|nr:MCP four helix bundle domain-containing protein [Candidatus Eisenbacteria bacterium]MBU1948855.1 MCP four helix bundle domain-containing protein [Candidatus Eisenbacteria bacterium]MBU2691277.1 MCP four helix bundle domain-containing protein [Candidatus Eisenbacteria bacterium]